MISVGLSRNDAGQPVMREKAYPTSEQRFYEDGPSMAEEICAAGAVVFFRWSSRGRTSPTAPLLT